jgi:hypothetical protein
VATPQVITHFAVGAAVTILIVTLAVPGVRYPRTWTIVGGGWAPVPDGSKLYASEGSLAFHASIRANVFWGHRLLDGLDAGDSTLWASAAVAALLAATMLAEYRSYRTVGAVRSGLHEYGLVDGENRDT